MRTIIEESRFTQELSLIESDAKRADEFIDGAKYILSRNPEFGNCIGDNSNVWTLALVEIHDHPPLVLYYTFDDSRVWFLSIIISQ